MKQNDIIRHYRILRGKTQKQIAEKLGMTHSGYSKYERGERRISTDLWIELSMILDFPFGLLLGERDEAIKYDSRLRFDIPLDAIAYDVKMKQDKMTKDELRSAAILFRETYEKLEAEKVLWIKNMQPKDFDTIVKEFKIDFLYEDERK